MADPVEVDRPKASRLPFWLAGCCLLWALGACGGPSLAVLRNTAPSPSALWIPSEGERPKAEPHAPLQICAELEHRPWGLGDVALRNKHHARAARADTLAAAAECGSRLGDYCTVGVSSNIPLFTGFSQSYNVEKVKVHRRATRERERTLERQVILEVYTAYCALHTATQEVRTADDLVVNARQSEEVALGRCREGVGTILDFTTAQTVLAATPGPNRSSPGGAGTHPWSSSPTTPACWT